MTREEHCEKLGMLIGNLQSLELALRAFLSERHSTMEPDVNVDEAKVGDWVASNSFTNYMSLGQLVRKFNGFVQGSTPEAMLDPSVVEIRDALAHGRLWSKRRSFPLRLFRFGEPKNNRVQIIMNEDLIHPNPSN